MEQVDNTKQVVVGEEEESKIFETCKIHNKQSIFLNVELNQSEDASLLKCSSCVTKNQIGNQSLLAIEDILSCKEDTILDNWPLNKDNELIDSLQGIKLEKKSDLDTFFKKFRLTIHEKIDQIEEILTSRIEEMEEQRKKIISIYNNLSKKDQLKELTIALTKDSKESTKLIKNLIKSMQQKYEQNYSNFQSIKNNFSIYTNQLSIQNLTTFQGQIENVLQNLHTIFSCKVVNLSVLKSGEIIKIASPPNFQNSKQNGLFQQNNSNFSQGLFGLNQFQCKI